MTDISEKLWPDYRRIEFRREYLITKKENEDDPAEVIAVCPTWDAAHEIMGALNFYRDRNTP